MRAVVLVLALAACQHRDVQDVLSAHRQSERRIAAPASTTPRPWAVGQWVLYKITDGVRAGYGKFAVVATGDCGTWVESIAVMDKYDDRVTIKTCYREPTFDSNAVQAIMMRQHDRTVQVDFRNNQNPHSKQKLLGS